MPSEEFEQFRDYQKERLDEIRAETKAACDEADRRIRELENYNNREIGTVQTLGGLTKNLSIGTAIIIPLIILFVTWVYHRIDNMQDKINAQTRQLEAASSKAKEDIGHATEEYLKDRFKNLPISESTRIFIYYPNRSCPDGWSRLKTVVPVFNDEAPNSPFFTKNGKALSENYTFGDAAICVEKSLLH